MGSIDTWRSIWERQFPKPRAVEFSIPVMTNDYCRDCRFCCGPQPEAEPFPMALLDSQVSERTKDDYWLLDAHTVSLDQRGCRALTKCGCRMERELRPIACNIFPIVLVGKRLYLYRVCPASMFVPRDKMHDMAVRIRDWLNTLPSTDVERIAIARTPQDLAEKYLDLDLPVTGCKA